MCRLSFSHVGVLNLLGACRCSSGCSKLISWPLLSSWTRESHVSEPLDGAVGWCSQGVAQEVRSLAGSVPVVPSNATVITSTLNLSLAPTAPVRPALVLTHALYIQQYRTPTPSLFVFLFLSHRHHTGSLPPLSHCWQWNITATARTGTV